MNSQDYRNLQEAYLNVYEQEEALDEGIGSAIKGLFGKKKEPEAQKPLSRGAELRQKYGTETSPKRQILDRTGAKAKRDKEKYGDSTYSRSVATNSAAEHERYLRAGYSKYGAGEGSGGQGGSGERGGGNAARRRAEKLNNSYDLFDYMMEYLIDEGYADTNENALVIMTNMSEEWRESILLGEGIRNPDVPRRPLPQFLAAKEIMRQNAKQAEKDASTNRLKKLIRSRSGKPPEPPTDDPAGNNSTPRGGGVKQMLNPENKPPRPREREFYKPPEGTENLKDRTSKIAPFGTVYEPPAAPKKRR
jgi:hypothetical protein